MSPRPIVSPASNYILRAGLGFAATFGAAALMERLLDDPDADGTSVGRLDRKEGLDLVAGLDSGLGAITVFTAAFVLSQLYSHSRVDLTARELAFMKNTYALGGGAVVGAVFAGRTFNRPDAYVTRNFPVDSPILQQLNAGTLGAAPNSLTQALPVATTTEGAALTPSS